MCTRDTSWHFGDLKHDCNAKLVSTGTSAGPPIACIAILSLGEALFFAFPSRYLLYDRNTAAPAAIGAILAASCLYFFLGAALTDPGVIPPSANGPYLQVEMRPPRTQHIITNQGKCTLRYCDVCNIYRPPRAEHCTTCRNCVLKFDHRNCIGQRNYRYFYGFIISACLLIILAVTCSAITIGLIVTATMQIDTYTAGSIALLIYCLLWGSFTFALGGMHTYLLATDQTTYDLLRPDMTAEKRRFSFRSARAGFRSLFIPNPPSLVREFFRMPEIVRGDTHAAKELSPSDYNNMMSGTWTEIAGRNKASLTSTSLHMMSPQQKLDDLLDEVGGVMPTWGETNAVSKVAIIDTKQASNSEVATTVAPIDKAREDLGTDRAINESVPIQLDARTDREPTTLDHGKAKVYTTPEKRITVAVRSEQSPISKEPLKEALDTKQLDMA